MSELSDKGCIACGWTFEKQSCCRYSSHLKLFFGSSKRGVWPIGSDMILKDCPDEGLKAKVEAKTLKYLAAYTDIPVPTIIREWVDQRYFVMNERIDGQTFEEAWPSMFDVRIPKDGYCRSSCSRHF
jgi:hypothetical protein